MSKSGYTHCACRDCFDTTISDDMGDPELCSKCHEAGCERERDGGGECYRIDAYGCGEPLALDVDLLNAEPRD